jgi:glycerol-3-phosphate dehydrogenase
LRLSEREHALVTARAEQAGVSVQRLLVEAATLPERTTAERHALYTTLLATQRAVTGAAKNLNQVAKGVNSTGALPLGWEATAAALRRGLATLEAVLGELGGTGVP